MMPASEDIDLAKLGERLAEMGQPPLSFDPLFAKLKVLLVAESKRCFDEQRGPDGDPWLPLKWPRERPRDRRAKSKGTGQKALRDTGALMQSVTATQIGPMQMTWGSGLEYAAAHNYGHTFHRPEKRRTKPWVFTDRRTGRQVFTRHIRAHTQTIPPRPFVGISREMANTITGMAAAFVLKELGRRGLRV
ncbi:MAG: phage virion morphogenesis protein [Patescibacteria group bacterium]|nr:phage virion morphogenesis protein [Patescibacteria group bacterium]